MQHDPRNDNHVVSWNNLFSSDAASNDGDDSSSSCGSVNSSTDTTPSEVCDSIDKQHETHHSQPFIQAPPQPFTQAPPPSYAHNIQSLRYLGSDAQINAQVRGLSPEERCSMLDAILRGHDPALFLDLCTKDRGVVIAQLLSATPSPSSKHQHHQQQDHQKDPSADIYFQATTQLLENHWTQLCRGQYGSIAIGRLFTALPSVPYKQYVAQLALRHWVALSQQQYGNFVMRDILQVAGQNVAEFDFVFAHLSADLAQPLTFSRLAECKFSGHVVETVMSHAPTRYIQQICTPLFTTNLGINICVSLGNHKHGNYPLQAVFKAVSNRDCDPRESLVPTLCNVIWPRLGRSQYGPNLFKAARPGTLGAPPAGVSTVATAEVYSFPSTASSSTSNTTSPPGPHGSTSVRVGTSVYPQPQYQTGTLNPAAQSFQPASQQQQDAGALSGSLPSYSATVKIQSPQSASHPVIHAGRFGYTRTVN